MNSGGAYIHYTEDLSESQSSEYSYDGVSETENNSPVLGDITNPQYILDNYHQRLSPLERKEILHYSKIHYISDLNYKLAANSDSDCQDGDGFYLMVPGDHIKYRYEIVGEIGKGTYSQVFKAFDHKEKKFVAIKLMRHGYDYIASEEARILDYLVENRCGDHYIIELRKKFVFRGHPCFVFDLLAGSLYDIIMKQGGLNLALIKRYAIQLLDALKFMHEKGVIHCDLKAENILIEEDGEGGKVRIADFGLSCFSHEELSLEVQSLWCRSPEVLCGLKYNSQIDMWSFGCIVAFMVKGNYVFRGCNEKEQKEEYEEILGSIQLENRNGLIKINRGGNFSTSTALANPLNTFDEKFLNFVGACLEYDPKNRITPGDALNHGWITEDVSNCRSGLVENTSMESLIEFC